MKEITEAKKIFYDSIGGKDLRNVDLIMQEINPKEKDMLEYPDVEAVISSRWPVLEDDEGIMLKDLIDYLEKNSYINIEEKERYLEILNNGDKDLLIVLNENVFFQQEDPEDNLAAITYDDYQDFVSLLKKVREDKRNPILNFFKENQDNPLYKDVDKIIEKKVSLEDLYSNVINFHLKDEILESLEHETETTEELLKVVEIIEERKEKVFEKLIENDLYQNQFNLRLSSEIFLLKNEIKNLEEPLTQETWDNNINLKERLIYFNILLNNNKKEKNLIEEMSILIEKDLTEENKEKFLKNYEQLSYLKLNPKIKEEIKNLFDQENFEELSKILEAQQDLLGKRIENLKVEIKGDSKTEGLEFIIKKKSEDEDFKVYNKYENFLELDNFEIPKHDENFSKLKSIKDLDIVEKIKEENYQESKYIDYSEDNLDLKEIKIIENKGIYDELESLRKTLKNLKGLTYEEYISKTPKNEVLSKEDFKRELEGTITQEDFDLNKEHIVLLDDDGNPKVEEGKSEIVKINPVELQRKIAYFEILKKETDNDNKKVNEIIKSFENLRKLEEKEEISQSEKNKILRESLKIFNSLSKNSMTDNFKDEIQKAFTVGNVEKLIEKLKLKEEVLTQRTEILDIKLNGGIGKNQEGINTILHQKSRTQDPLELTRFKNLIKKSETFNEEELLEDIENEFNKFRMIMSEKDKELIQKLDMADREELNLLELVFPLKSIKQAALLLDCAGFLALKGYKTYSEKMAVKKVKNDLKEFSDKIRDLNKIDLEKLKKIGNGILKSLNSFDDPNIKKKIEKITNQSEDFISKNSNLIEKVENLLKKISKNELETRLLNQKFLENDSVFNVDGHYNLYKKNKELLAEIQNNFLKEFEEIKNNEDLQPGEKEAELESLKNKEVESIDNIVKIINDIEDLYEFPKTTGEVNFENLVQQGINEDILSNLREHKENGLENLIATENSEYDILLKAYVSATNNEKNTEDDLDKDQKSLTTLENEIKKLEGTENITLASGTKINISPYKKQILNKIKRIKNRIKDIKNQRLLENEKNGIVQEERKESISEFDDI